MGCLPWGGISPTIPNILQAPHLTRFIYVWVRGNKKKGPVSSIETVTSAITAMMLKPIRVQCSDVYDEYYTFSYFYLLKLEHSGSWEKLKVLCCKNRISNIILLAAASWNIVLFPLYEGLYIFLDIKYWLNHYKFCGGLFIFCRGGYKNINM